MVNVTVCYDAMHWEQQAKQRMNHRFDPKTIPPRPSKPPCTPTTNLLPTNHNSATTPHQPETSQTTPRTPKPYDNMLGLDGKLKLEELECRHKNKLCLVCGAGNHLLVNAPPLNRDVPPNCRLLRNQKLLQGRRWNPRNWKTNE